MPTCPPWCVEHSVVDGVSYHEGAERLVVVEEVRGPDSRVTLMTSQAFVGEVAHVEVRTNAIEADPGAPPLLLLEEAEARALAAALTAVADELAAGQ